MYIKMYIQIHLRENNYKEKSLISLSTVYANLSNILKCFLWIFFNNEIIRVHSLLYFFIRINKRLACVTILITSLFCRGNK